MIRQRFTFPAARVLLLAGALFGITGLRQARAATPQELAMAVFRLPSHGASATVIATDRGRSWLLCCGHAFQGADRNRPITADVPARAPGARPKVVGIQLVDVDYDSDLSLIVLRAGPLDYVAPVAPAGHAPGSQLLSVGFDEMRLPATERPASIVWNTNRITFTRERPWHGRSGGALLDVDAGCLIGVVSGYEVTGQRRGMYAAHAAIMKFLALQKGDRTLGLRSPDPFLEPRQRGTAPHSELGGQVGRHLKGGFSTPLPLCPPFSKT